MIPSLNGIEISVKGATSVLLGAKGLNKAVKNNSRGPLLHLSAPILRPPPNELQLRSPPALSQLTWRLSPLGDGTALPGSPRDGEDTALPCSEKRIF